MKKPVLLLFILLLLAFSVACVADHPPFAGNPVETIHDTYRRIYTEYMPSGSFLLSGGFEYQHYGQDGSIRICLPVADSN